MLPITRANLQNFCRACLRELTLTKETNHSANETARNTNLYPHRICYSCQIKITTLKGFQHKVIIATGVLRLIIEEESDKSNDSALLKLKSICRVCLKKQSNELYSTKKDKELFSDMFQCSGLHLIAAGVPTELLEITDLLIGDPRFPDALCNKCFATLKSFIEFRAITKHTSEYLKNVLDESDDIATNDTDLMLDTPVKSEEFYNSDKTEAFERLPFYTSEVLDLNCFYNENTTNSEPKVNNENNFNFLHEDVKNCNSEIFGCENYFDATENRSSLESNSDEEFQLDNKLSFNTKYENEHNQKHTKVTESLIQKKIRSFKNLSKSYKIKTPSNNLTGHNEKIINQQGVKTQCNKNKRNLREKSKNELESVTGFVISNSAVHDSKNLTIKTKIGKKFKTTFECDECKKTFYKKYTYEAHIKGVHQGIETPFACPYCPKSFRLVQVLHRHINCSHECVFDNNDSEVKIKRFKSHICLFCQRVFKRKDHLKEHVLAVHEGLKPFECSVCGKTFGTKNTQLRHEKNHSNEKPYSCEYCAKRYNSESELKVHIQRHTTNPELLCSICKRAKPNAEELKKHVEMHSKAFQCATCGKIFKKVFHLREHESTVHLKLRSLKCSYCDLTFSIRKTLKNHELSHNSLGRPETCVLCKLNFRTKRSLLLHIKKAHPNESTNK